MAISVKSVEDSEYSGYAVASSGFLGDGESGGGGVSGGDGVSAWSLGDPAAFAAAGLGDELTRFGAVQDTLAVNDFVLTVGKQLDADYNNEERGWFKTRKGKEAKGLYAEWQDRAGRIWEEEAPKSLNSRQLELVQKPLTALFAAQNRRVGGFEAENLLTWNKQRAELAVSDALNLAAANASDPEGLALALASLRNSYAALGRMNGWDEPTTAEHTNRAVGTMLAKSAAALTKQDPRNALDFIVAHRGLIPDDPALKGLFLQTMEAGYEHLIQVDPEQALALLSDGPDRRGGRGGPHGPGAADRAGQGGPADGLDEPDEADFSDEADEPDEADFSDEADEADEALLADEADKAGRAGAISTAEETEASIFAAEYRKYVPPERIALMRGRAEAELRSRERLKEERMGALQATLDASLLRICLEGDCGPLQKAEEQLAGLDKKNEAQALADLRPLLVQGHSWLEARRFEPFDSQRSGLEEFYGAAGRAAGSGNRGDEGGKVKAEEDLAGIEKGGGGAKNDRTGEPSALGAQASPADLIPGALAVSRQAVNERQSLFEADPAAYVAVHPLLGGIDPESGEPLGVEAFCEREGISWEDHIDRSLRLQARTGKGTGVSPRVLSRDRAAAIKDSFESLENPREKAALLRDLARRGGKHADRVFTEAGLPASVSAYAALYPNLPASETARLIRAADTTLDGMDLPDSRKAEIRRRVEASPLSKALHLVDQFFASAEAGLARNSAGQVSGQVSGQGPERESSPAADNHGAALFLPPSQGAESSPAVGGQGGEPSPVAQDPGVGALPSAGGQSGLEHSQTGLEHDQSEQSGEASLAAAQGRELSSSEGGQEARQGQGARSAPVVGEMLRALESFVGLGGNLTDLERRIPQDVRPVIKAHLKGLAMAASGPALIAGGIAGAVSESNYFQKQEESQAPAKQRTWWEQTGHELGVGTRGILDGITGAADYVAAPARNALNSVNGFFGGDPDYFKPLGTILSDTLGLPTAETDTERLAYSMSKGGTEGMVLFWGVNTFIGQAAVSGNSTVAKAIVEVFGKNPTEQVISGVGSEALVQWVENNEGGSAAIITAALIGGALGGGAGKKIDKALGVTDDVAKAGIKAEVKAGQAATKAEAAAKGAGKAFNGSGSLVFEDKKWDYLFGRVTSTKHSQDRSIQLKEAMIKLGIEETPESKKILLDHLDEVARTYPPISGKKGGEVSSAAKEMYEAKEIVEKYSFFTGPSGVKVKLETAYEVCDDGSLRFVTIIPKFLKANYGGKP